MTAAEKNAIHATGVEKEYLDGDRRLKVLTGVDISIAPGEFVSIIGQSGSGKSTLLHILGALDRPTRGEVSLNGQQYSKLSDGQLAKLRCSSVGFVYQFHHLLPEFTALENVLMPGLIAGTSQGEAVRRAEELLNRVGLSQRMTHRPSKLSGGEQQRVAIARSLLNNPVVVLADEPTGNLDTRTSGGVLDFLLEITVGTGKSLVMVTHDPAIAKRANRCFHLVQGVLRPE